MKTCSKCHEAKQESEFSKRSSATDGLQCSCKACQKKAKAQWFAKNSSVSIARSAEYYAKNKAKIKLADSIRHAKNSVINKKRRIENRLANPDREKAYRAEWYAKNKASNRVRAHNRRARVRVAGGKLSASIAEKLFKLQRGKCACGCGQPLGDDYHLDHIMPLALGGSNTDDNIQLLTATCNLKKSSRHPVEFMQSRGFLL